MYEVFIFNNQEWFLIDPPTLQFYIESAPKVFTFKKLRKDYPDFHALRDHKSLIEDYTFNRLWLWDSATIDLNLYSPAMMKAHIHPILRDDQFAALLERKFFQEIAAMMFTVMADGQEQVRHHWCFNDLIPPAPLEWEEYHEPK